MRFFKSEGVTAFPVRQLPVISRVVVARFAKNFNSFPISVVET